MGLIAFAQIATKNIQMVPSGLQNFAEWLVEGMYDFFTEILGKELVKKTFWFFCTLFLFILCTNWFGLIPGVGTVGYGTTDAAGHFHLTKPFLRGGNADLNMTLAMSLTFFLLWTVWSLQALGPGGIAKHLFSSGASGNRDVLQVMADVFNARVFPSPVRASGSLGAALRAWHAYDHAHGGAISWPDVVRDLATPDPATAIEPGPSATTVYPQMQRDYAAFESRHFS